MTEEEKREKRRLYNREVYAWRKENGLCVNCGKEKAEKGYSKCLQCRMDHRESSMKSHYKHRNDEGYLQHKAETSKKTFYKRKEQHICIRCGKKMPDSVTTIYCERCKVIVNRKDRERAHEAGVLPNILRGNGIYCAICRKPVDKQGKKLCSKCYDNACNALVKARAAIPTDCYMRQAIKAQWRESENNKKIFAERVKR